MKVAVIGSHAYKDKMTSYAIQLEEQQHEVKIPAFDNHADLNELGICEYNLSLIEWAERVDLFWDKRSMGTLFDFGMVFALRKPFRIVYLEPKTFMNLMKQYEEKSHGR
jgi:hypothetical protein